MHQVIRKSNVAACLTDNQIVKTLNELIEATRKVWREIELNVSNKAVPYYTRIFIGSFVTAWLFAFFQRVETQHLRQLIENCAACRVFPGEWSSAVLKQLFNRLERTQLSIISISSSVSFVSFLPTTCLARYF